MTTVEKIIAQFPGVSKSEWLEKIKKDLKNIDPNSLNWQMASHISVDAFPHPDDRSTTDSLLFPPIDWEIDEKISVTHPLESRQQALEALQFGATSLTFEWDSLPTTSEFSNTLEGIYLDFISLNFCGKAVAQNPGYFLGLLESECTQRGMDTRVLQGSLAFNLNDFATTRPQIDWRYLADLLQFSQEKFPNFKILQVAAPTEWHLPQQADVALSEVLSDANFYLKKLTEKGIEAQKVVNAIHFSMPIGKSYFVEIAKLRALKLLWFNVVRAWKVPLTLPFIAATLAEAVFTDELYTNMIAATTQSMSAVIGGVQRLTVLPYDEGREAQSKYSKSFGRRIARNVQHLLKSESGLHEIADPAAGSFYIEQLTEKLATSAWAALQQKN